MFYRNDVTGEQQAPHRIGQTEDGRPVYQPIEGWTPVDGEGRPIEVRCDEDGNWTAAAASR